MKEEMAKLNDLAAIAFIEENYNKIFNEAEKLNDLWDFKIRIDETLEKLVKKLKELITNEKEQGKIEEENNIMDELSILQLNIELLKLLKLILKLFHIKKFGNINTSLKFEPLFEILVYSEDLEVKKYNAKN